MPGQATITIRDKQWLVTLATTPEELIQGLGNLASIPPGTGMLFDLGQDQIIQVTTVPMLFPLDVVFIHSTQGVTEVVRDVAPGLLVTSSLSARYFLEVNAGEAEGIQPGDPVLIEALGVAPQEGSTDSVVNFGLQMGVLVLGLGMGNVVYRRFIQGPFAKSQEKAEELAQKAGIRLKKLLPETQFEEPIWEEVRRFLEPTRADVRVEVWEERDRLHIGIQDKWTGEYLVSWWDDDARDMFEMGFFKRQPNLEESVLTYAEEMGILAPQSLSLSVYPQTQETWPRSLEEALRAVEKYAASMRRAVEKYAAKAQAAAQRYRQGAERAIGTYRRYVLSRWERVRRGTSTLMTPGTERGCLIGPAESPVEVAYFSDSCEQCAQSVDHTGYRPQLERAFQEAIRRARSKT